MPNARPNLSLGLVQHGSCSIRRYGSTPPLPPLRAAVYVPQEQPTVIDEESGTLYRVRSHGNRKLPMPPFMDARVIEAKTRHKQTKQEPIKAGHTGLQQDLAANAYAQAFATPVRCCGLTKARLPAHFLQAFTAQFVKIQGPDIKNRAKSEIVPALAKDCAPTSQKNRFANSTTYVLNSAAALGYLDSNSGNWFSLPNERLYEQAMLQAGSKNAKKKDIWMVDPDMKGKVRDWLIRDVEVELDRLMLRRLRGKVAPGWALRILQEFRSDFSTSSQSSDGEGDVLLSNAKEFFQLVTDVEELPDREISSAFASVVVLPPCLGIAGNGSLPDASLGSSQVYKLAATYAIDNHHLADTTDVANALSRWLAIANLLEPESEDDGEDHKHIASRERSVLGIRRDQSTVNLRLALERLNMFVAAS